MMLKVLTAMLLSTSILFSTDARPAPPPEAPPPETPPSERKLIMPFEDSLSHATEFGILVPRPAGALIGEVTGRFRLPDIPPHLRTAGDDAAFWVGIPGTQSIHGTNNVESQLIQAGVIMRVTEEGTVNYIPFVEWWPDSARAVPPEHRTALGHLAVGHERTPDNAVG
ncbi:hypothetical protein F5880DRAFT_1571680 [Lentinula raphanica]|nr:hypothetical protein F5880DRAFT_1571680 [Lentinula raphanica]